MSKKQADDIKPQPAPAPLDSEPELTPEPEDESEGFDVDIKSTRGAFGQKAEPNRGVLEAIRRAGSQRELARILKVAQPSVMKWLWESCPAERAVEIEKALGVSRRIIRPDLFSEPELVHTSAPRTRVHEERYRKIEETNE